MRLWIPLAALSATSGCLPLPHTHLERPRILITVSDTAGRAIRGAILKLYETPGLAAAEYVVQDSGATVFRRRSVHLIHLLSDFEMPKTWTWCVQAGGFRIAAGLIGHTPPERIEVTLHEGGVDVCPPTWAGLDTLIRHGAVSHLEQ